MHGFFSYRLIAFLFLLTAALVAAQDSATNIGTFDINKVRELSTVQSDRPGASAATAPAAARRESTSYAFVMLRVIGALALIVAILIGAGWLIRKTGLGRSSRLGGNNVMDIIEVLQLGQNKNVVLFRVKETLYLCGQTASNLSLFDKIEGREAEELLTASRGRPAIGQFKDAFNQFVTKMKKQP